MKLFILCLSLLVVEGLCRVDGPCTVQSSRKGRSKPLTGTYQKRGKCLESGHAAFSKSESTTAPTLSDKEDSFDEEDEALQCCVETTCGDNGKCRNNVEGNPCAKGAYLPNLNRARNLCPASSSYDNVQCCSETIDHNAHRWLRTRQFDSLSTTGASIAANYENTFGSGVTTTPGNSDIHFSTDGNSFANPSTTPGSPALSNIPATAPESDPAPVIQATAPQPPISNSNFNSVSTPTNPSGTDTALNPVSGYSVIPNSNFNSLSTPTNSNGDDTNLNLDSGNNYIPLKLDAQHEWQQLSPIQDKGFGISANPGSTLSSPPAVNIRMGSITTTIKPGTNSMDALNHPFSAFDRGGFVGVSTHFKSR